MHRPTAILLLLLLHSVSLTAAEDSRQANIVKAFTQKYCVACHDGDSAEANLDLASFNGVIPKSAAKDWDSSKWEKIVRRLQSRQMPPADSDRPIEKEYDQIVAALSNTLSDFDAKYPYVGNTPRIRRLTRYEFQNAIRDILHLEVNAAQLLPADESSHGFDNITVGELSPLLLSRYIKAAEEISRIAVGSRRVSPDGVILRIPADLTQKSHIQGLPLGTRGGGILQQNFAQGGQYDVQIRLTRDRDENIEGLRGQQQIDIILDRKRVHRFELKPPQGGSWNSKDDTTIDANLVARISIPSGPHTIGVAFPQKSRSLLEIKRQPFDASYNRHRHPRQSPALFEISVVGPFEPTGPGDTPSRSRIFSARPTGGADELASAKAIFRPILERAYRRRITNEDLATPLRFFKNARKDKDFDASIGAGIAAVLVNPNFLFRVESPPLGNEGAPLSPINQFELASRLSFFLWSSIPDDRLRRLAQEGVLSQPSVLSSEVHRMLKHEKSFALTQNFAAQWLYLRNLDSITPDLRRFPDFDENLRRAFRKETEMLFADVVSRDLPVHKLLKSSETFLNERLATHYDIRGIKGSHFRRVVLPETSNRGGILRHGSILTVTSYATRTSPTIRGNWVLKNIIGTPPPPPPPDVPTLKKEQVGKSLTFRERLAEHRSNPACASCHDLIDPIGFALENYDAVGRWRIFENDQTLDATGILPDGSNVNSIAELEKAILQHPELFAQTLTEKLMIYALGRGLEPRDGPAVREVVELARQHEYRFSSLILGIVQSRAFRMRNTP